MARDTPRPAIALATVVLAAGILVGCSAPPPQPPPGRMAVVDGTPIRFEWVRFSPRGEARLRGHYGGKTRSSGARGEREFYVADSLAGIPIWHVVLLRDATGRAALESSAEVLVRSEGAALASVWSTATAPLPNPFEFSAPPDAFEVPGPGSEREDRVEPDLPLSSATTLTAVGPLAQPWVVLSGPDLVEAEGILVARGGGAHGVAAEATTQVDVGLRAGGWKQARYAYAVFQLFVPDSMAGVRCFHVLRVYSEAHTRLARRGRADRLLLDAWFDDSPSFDGWARVSMRRRGSLLIADRVTVYEPLETQPDVWGRWRP